jgi:hypothetical protein
MVSQEFRRELSNKAFETVELLQEALGQALLPFSGRTLLASEGSPVSPGGWRPSMRCDINNPDRYNASLTVYELVHPDLGYPDPLRKLDLVISRSFRNTSSNISPREAGALASV